jgi:NLR family CARD domain-containing protein 3
MSTTTHKETAFDYSGVKDKRGTVLEIEVGRVDVGASISFLSQYPGEAEFLMQPLACLEV